MSKIPLQVLIVEDSIDDALLEVRHLEKYGYSVTYDVVDDAFKMRNALQKNWDVIISDYSMPHFNGLDALRLKKELDLDIPFIVVSGVVGDELAAETVKQGANDYVLKNNLARLGAVVAKELKEHAARREMGRYEKELLLSEARFTALVQTNILGIFTMDCKGVVNESNDYFLDLIGYSVEDIRQCKINERDITPGGYESIDASGTGEMNVKGYCTPYEKEYIRKDDSRIPVLVGFGLLDACEQTRIGYVADLSTIRHAEKESAMAKERSALDTGQLNALLRTMADGVIISDLNGQLINISPLAMQFFEVGPSTRFRRFWADLYDRIEMKGPEGNVLFPDQMPFARVLRGETFANLELEVREKSSGRKKVGIFGGSPVLNRAGNPGLAVVTLKDITERKARELDAQLKNIQVEIYLDLLGHDINNQNQAGILYLEIAQEKLELGAENRELIERPLEAFRASSKMIETVRKLECLREKTAGHEIIDLGQLLVGVSSAQPRLFPGRQITINCAPPAGNYIVGTGALVDIFSILINNLIKQTTGDVSIDIGLSKDLQEGKQYYKVTIEDDGPGIPDDLKKYLFTRYKKADSRLSYVNRRLYLVRVLVESFGGRVWVDDRVSRDYTKGSRFVVLLPLVAG
ncbi:hybrid sensor histidine kinase/response regulator [Methanocella sp. MCL-LM]|uniref:hybrid sensor histidine kinase/response regulator n=1 Tax=Methanocella sp. MCL-LM TaxID=3412035 RepID=UPI003C795518